MTPAELTAAAALVKLKPSLGKSTIPVSKDVAVSVSIYEAGKVTVDWIESERGLTKIYNIFGSIFKTRDPLCYDAILPEMRIIDDVYLFIVFSDTAFVFDLESYHTQLVALSPTRSILGISPNGNIYTNGPVSSDVFQIRCNSRASKIRHGIFGPTPLTF